MKIGKFSVIENLMPISEITMYCMARGICKNKKNSVCDFE